MLETRNWFRILNIRISILFRVSDFVLRVYHCFNFFPYFNLYIDLIKS
jgi:hypothetical protein